MQFEAQPRIQNEKIRLEPLNPEDFESLYAVAADPLLWEQHPNQNRYRRKGFATYFQGAIESRSAVRAFDNPSGTLIGCSRSMIWIQRSASLPSTIPSSPAVFGAAAATKRSNRSCSGTPFDSSTG
jgi:hypothetical protein